MNDGRWVRVIVGVTERVEVNQCDLIYVCEPCEEMNIVSKNTNEAEKAPSNLSAATLHVLGLSFLFRSASASLLWKGEPPTNVD